MKKFFLGLIALLVSATVFAERVTPDDAALVANHFMNVASTSNARKATPSKKMVLKKAASATENQYYIYENENGEGWVMIAANDVAHPILAYSETGSFRTDNMPKNIACWVNKYNRRIREAEEANATAIEEVKQEWEMLRKGTSRKATVIVAPLIKTKWDQTEPYWNKCPQKSGTHALTGCVATAMAQVMNYWKWPETGTGSNSVTFNSTTYTVDFSTGHYDWDNMLDKYVEYYEDDSKVRISTTSGTAAQQEAVATLMYHCGVAADMEYGTSVSGAYTIYPNKNSTSTRCAQYALKNNFGYDATTLKGYYRPGGYGYTAVDDATWHNLLKTELDAKRPIMYAGADSDGGHSFICDGYNSDNLYHFNWGWSGYCDGYYQIDDLTPGIGGSGSGNGSYNEDQDIIIGIQPPSTGHAVVVNGTGCTITPSALGVENGNALTATITPTDASYDFTSLTVKLGSTTLTSGTHYTLSSDKKSLTIYASAITGDASNDLTITAVWTKNRYIYAMLGENCTEELEGMVAKNAALNLTITPDAGFALTNAACWDVEMGGVALVYGTGFTYNASTNTFSIASVTGDINILAYGGKEITWRSVGEIFTTNMAFSNKLTLPATNPEACEGKVFVGWCAQASYSSDNAPTFVQDNDNAEQSTYYAVFATETNTGSATWNLVTDASSLKVGDVLVIACKSQNVTAGEFSSLVMSSVSSTFSGDQITSLGDETVELTLGGSEGTWTLSSSGDLLGATAEKKLAWDNGTTTWSISISGDDATIQNGTSSYGRFLYNSSNPRFTTYTSTTSATMLLPQLYRKTGGISYSAYTTTCVPPTYYNITLNAGANGTLATNPETQAIEGATVTITATPATHYHLATLTVKDASNANVAVSGEGNVRTFTMPAKAVTVTATFEEDTKYTVNFYVNGSVEKTQNLYAGETAVAPSFDACDGFTFKGWVTAAITTETTVAPAYITNFTVSGAQNYYAVFSRVEAGGTPVLTDNYEKITSTADLETGNYVVVGYYSSNYYAMKNALTSNGYYIDQVQVYPSENVISTTNSAIIWKLSVNGNQLSFYNETVGKYLRIYQSGSYTNAGLTTSTSDNINFTYSVEDGWWKFINTGVSGYYLEYYGSKSDFTAYTTAGSDPIYLYKQKEESTATTYYSTSCVEPTKYGITISPSTHGSLETAPATEAAAGRTVTVTATPDTHYHLATLTVKDADNASIAVSGEGNTRTFVMPEKAVTISATFAEDTKYTVEFSNKGTTIASTSYYLGEEVILPADPSAGCDAYTFVGWWTSQLDSSNTTAQTWITANFNCTGAQTLYAIYSKTVEGAGESQVASVTFLSTGTTNDDGTERTTSSAIRTYLVDTESGISSYSGSKLYKGKNGLKIGASNAGYITLTLENTVSVTKVVVNASQYGSDTGELEVEAGSTSLGTQSPAANLEYVADPAVETNEITVSTTAKRAYVTSISIIAGGSSTTYYSSSVSCSGTDIESIFENAPKATKVLYNGQVVIIRDGVYYTILGQPIK